MYKIDRRGVRSKNRSLGNYQIKEVYGQLELLLYYLYTLFWRIGGGRGYFSLFEIYFVIALDDRLKSIGR